MENKVTEQVKEVVDFKDIHKYTHKAVEVLKDPVNRIGIGIVGVGSCIGLTVSGIVELKLKNK